MNSPVYQYLSLLHRTELIQPKPRCSNGFSHGRSTKREPTSVGNPVFAVRLYRSRSATRAMRAWRSCFLLLTGIYSTSLAFRVQDLGTPRIGYQLAHDPLLQWSCIGIGSHMMNVFSCQPLHRNHPTNLLTACVAIISNSVTRSTFSFPAADSCSCPTSSQPVCSHITVPHISNMLPGHWIINHLPSNGDTVGILTLSDLL